MNLNRLKTRIKEIERRLSEIDIEYIIKTNEYNQLHMEVIKQCNQDSLLISDLQLDSKLK